MARRKDRWPTRSLTASNLTDCWHAPPVPPSPREANGAVYAGGDRLADSYRRYHPINPITRYDPYDPFPPRRGHRPPGKVVVQQAADHPTWGV